MSSTKGSPKAYGTKYWFGEAVEPALPPDIVGNQFLHTGEPVMSSATLIIVPEQEAPQGTGALTPRSSAWMGSMLTTNLGQASPSSRRAPNSRSLVASSARRGRLLDMVPRARAVA